MKIWDIQIFLPNSKELSDPNPHMNPATVKKI